MFSYPGTLLTARNESVLARLLHPMLKAANLNTFVAGYDHNWDNVRDELIHSIKRLCWIIMYTY